MTGDALTPQHGPGTDATPDQNPDTPRPSGDAPIEAASETYSHMVWRLFKSNRIAMLGLTILGLMYILAVFAPFIANRFPFIWRAVPKPDTTLNQTDLDTLAGIMSPEQLQSLRAHTGNTETDSTHNAVPVTVFPLFTQFIEPKETIDRVFNLMAVFWFGMMFYLPIMALHKKRILLSWTVKRHAIVSLVATGAVLIAGLTFRGPDFSAYDNTPQSAPFDRFFNVAVLTGILLLIYPILKAGEWKNRLRAWTLPRHLSAISILVAGLLIAGYGHAPVRDTGFNKLNALQKYEVHLFDLFGFFWIIMTLYHLKRIPRFAARLKTWSFGMHSGLSAVAAIILALVAGTTQTSRHFRADRWFTISKAGKMDAMSYYDMYTNDPFYKNDPNTFALFTPIKYGPLEDRTLEKLQPPLITGNAIKSVKRVNPADTRRRLLGTDDRGRDVAARMLYGTRISLSIGFVAVGIATFIGLIVGSLAGYYGGWLDIMISRIIEIVICFPTFFLILTIIAVLNPSLFNIMIIIGFTSWTGIARLVRGEILKLRRQDFVIAARALGLPNSRIIFRHILPNALGPVFVSVSFGVAGAILTESGLSFLGIGVPSPAPTWGEALRQAQQNIDKAWWLVTFPGIAIFLTVTAFNLVGDGLRDAMDPRLKR